jgi:hypothetical protein
MYRDRENSTKWIDRRKTIEITIHNIMDDLYSNNLRFH